MIKTKKLLAVTALAAVALAGCSSDDDAIGAPQGALPEDGVIRISATVNRLTAVRAADAYGGTTLGLYIRPVSSVDDWDNAIDKYIYPNVKFSTDDGGFTWLQNEFSPMLWKGEDTDYEYYAYAPADTKAVDDKVAYDLGKQAEQTEIQNDLLWTSGHGPANTLVTDRKLALTFDHALCKVAVQIEIGDEFYQDGAVENPIQTVTITSTRVRGSMNVLTGELESPNADGVLSFGVDGVHTPGAETGAGSYTTPYIFYAPGDETFTVGITTADNRSFAYTHNSAYGFGKGNVYVIKLKMGRSVLQLGEISVEDWKQGTAPNNGKLETE